MTGTGKVTYADEDLTASPYYAHLSTESQYWWLNAYKVTQIAVGQNTLVNTDAMISGWEIPLVFHIRPPTFTRASMLACVIALASIFDPRKGDQELIFEEFPNSYFIARRLSSSLPMDMGGYAKLDMTMGCTGPAYDTTESLENTYVTDGTTPFTLTSYGDSPADPYYLYTSYNSYIGDVVLENTSTGHTITWNGVLAASDTLGINMTPEHGVKRMVYKNGVPSLANVTGPGWPTLIPGANSMMFTGPTSGVLTSSWRDRHLIGKQ